MFAHLREMSLHCGTSFLRIVPLDCFENVFVVILSALRAASDAEYPQALFAEQSNNGIDQRQNNRVRRRLGERQVKIKIRFDKRIRIPSRTVHDIKSLSHCREILIVGADRCQSRDLRLQNFPNFYQIGPAIRIAALDNSVQRTAHRVGRSIRDESSTPRKRVDQPLFLKRFDGFAHGSPADAKLLGKVSFRGKLAAFAQFALEDRFLDLLNNLLVKTRRLNDFVQEMRLFYLAAEILFAASRAKYSN